MNTALSLPTVAACPSLNGLQWNGNGQVCVVTKSAIYILTPELGINFDLTSVTRASIPSESSIKHAVVVPPLGWFKTMIEYAKGHTPHVWAETSQDWGTIVLGSLDIVLRAIACSPCTLGRADARCLIATLSSNMDFALWTAPKNHLKGEWVKVVDLTKLFITHFTNLDEGVSPFTKTLHAQVTCIAWSQQALFGVLPAPLCDSSLLLAANRAGCLNFLRLYQEDHEAVQILHTLKVSENWVTHVAFSSWSIIQPGICQAYVAYGISDGSVGLVNVVHTLQSSMSIFAPEYALHTAFEPNGTLLYNADKRGITGLAWVTARGNKPILVHCKPGVVHLWSPPPSTATDHHALSSSGGIGWVGYRTLPIRTQRISTGSSCLHPISGLFLVRHRDALVLSLFDGSFHVIRDLFHEPAWSTSTVDGSDSIGVADSGTFTSEGLSVRSRTVFPRMERSDVRFTDVNRINGMLAHDDVSGTVMWLHEAARPTDFSYKNDAQQNSVFIMAKMWDDDPDVGDQCILDELTHILSGGAVGTGYDPIHLLRSVLLYLRDEGNLQRLHSRVLGILSLHPVLMIDPSLPTPNAASALPSWEDEASPEMRRSFCRSLRQELYGWDDLMSLRMRLSLADYCWKLSKDPQSREECGQVAEQLLSAISYRVLQTIVRHLTAVVGILTPDHAPFVKKIISRSTLPGAPPDLASEAQQLGNAIKSDSSVESCPACGANIPMADLNNAVCGNGHTWARCSITSFVISTPMARTCVGCCRKALSPQPPPPPPIPSDAASGGSGGEDAGNWLPPGVGVARCWIAEELLSAVCRCLFCGNSFASVL